MQINCKQIINILKKGSQIDKDDLNLLNVTIGQYPWYSPAHFAIMIAENKIDKAHTIHLSNLEKFYKVASILASKTPESQTSIEASELSDTAVKSWPQAIDFTIDDPFIESEDTETKTADANSDPIFDMPELNLEDVNTDNKGDNTEESNDLVDIFIKSKQHIVPNNKKQETDNKDLSRPINEEEEEQYLTETLAKIYFKQQHYDKAISTYIKLSLKFPEKSIYFASRIERIKEIIKNNENNA